MTSLNEFCGKCYKRLDNEATRGYCPSCFSGFLEHVNRNYGDFATKAGLPRRYHSVRFDTIKADADNQEAIDAAISMITAGGFLLLHGATGTGKTCIAAAVIHDVLIRGDKIYFTRSIDLFNSVRRGYGDKAKIDADDILKGYKRLPFLVVDDLGSEKFTEWIEQSVYDLIDYRHGEMLPLLITSNLSNPEIAEIYGARVSRRIKQAGPRVEMKGRDRSESD